MAFDPKTLDQPIDWHQPGYATFLANLQANILKGHGRDFTLNTLLSFAGAQRADVIELIHAIGGSVTSAATQLIEAERLRVFGRHGGAVVLFFLTAKGYDWLGLSPPADPAFRAGMAQRGGALLDPPQAKWWKHWSRTDTHAMLLVGDDDPGMLAHALDPLLKLIAAAKVTTHGPDAGQALRRPDPGNPKDLKGPGIEHFGYVDGRSQPLMLTDEIALEKKLDGGIDQFDPGVGPGKLALVPDPHGGRPDAFGSYLVYRRLEQNVRGFKEREGGFQFSGQPGNLADELALKDHSNTTPPGSNERERAGAMVVGRFEDGTSVELFDDSPSPLPAVPNNNFNYDGDPAGDRCPIHAHIRKTNPRRNQPEHLMARRGIPFGERDPESFEDPRTMPSGGVGLLFMAYNQDIARQFEFVQISWANNLDFPNSKAGIDPVIGQGKVTQQQWPSPWDSAGRKPFAFGGFVSMTGGEYFFAPSLAFLRNVA